jgi:hypothetical protein
MLLRYSDLVARGIVNNRMTLSNWIRRGIFPSGQLTGPNRTWGEDEVQAFLASRSPKPPAPKPVEIGDRFGRLIIVEFAERVSGRELEVLCDCDCGSRTVRVYASNLRKGLTQSCGCLLKEKATIHGESAHGPRASVEYRTWLGMRQRCRNPNIPAFKYYGGRGIAVCARWDVGENGKTGFECFLADMGRKPSPKHSIDRWPNPDGNYEPSNCRWATKRQQSKNRKRR